MQLAETLGLKSNDRGSNGGGDREGGGINLAESSSTTGNLLERVILCVVHVGAWSGEFTFRTGDLLSADGRVEDVWEGFRDFIKDGCVDTKVLG